MTTIIGKNVNELWARGLQTLKTYGIESDSRAGRVLVMQTPVTSVYHKPRERVLMDPRRDANPFFHLMESLWMLAGREDAAFLNRYVGDFGKRFAEFGDERHAYIHGAYGKRWRDTMGFDQLDAVVKKLRANPDDRQAVIQMWDATDQGGDFVAGGCEDLTGTFKDRPCNTHVYLRVRESRYTLSDEMCVDKVLDLTVLCRSNDVVWGAYGANAVHFSVLQEYLAGRIGVSVGVMYQFSNNYHGYVSVLSKYSTSTGEPNNPYEVAGLEAMPIGTSWGKWDNDLSLFMDWHDNELWGDTAGSVEPVIYANGWFSTVAVPVAMANKLWKMGARDEALLMADGIAASDWRFACTEWMHRRTK